MYQTPIPHILSWVTFLPLLGAIFLMFLKRPQDLPEHHGDHEHEAHGVPDAPSPLVVRDPARNAINWVALAFALATFVLSLVMLAAFQIGYVNSDTRNMQFLESASWIRIGTLAIDYRMGVDGISLLLIVLTTFLMVLSVLFSFGIKQRLKEFMVFLLLLETALIGVFCALDLVLFYVFWEAVLIPMYFLIGIFGHENRIYAAIKFFLYTFAGSILMLVAIVAVYRATGTFNVLALSNQAVPGSPGAKLYALNSANPQALMWMYAAFALAFMIKVPMFPFHTWLPDAHVEAPTAGSAILAGIMLKMGTYGFLRFCLPLFPEQAHETAVLFIVLAIIGIIYGSIVAAVQPDAKKLVAYSSVAHLGFVILGIFTFTPVGMMGALVQNINHGISTPMLFFLVGMLYERRHTRLISEFGGLKRVVPALAAMTLLATLSSIAVPFFNGFVGEFPILLGSWVSAQTKPVGGYWSTALAATGMILSAVYMLWWFHRIMLGPITKPVNRHLPDLDLNEWFVLTPLVAIIFWVGLWSQFWTQRMDTSVRMLLPANERRLEDTLPITSVLEREYSQSDLAPLGGLERRRRQAPIGNPAPPTVPPAAAPGGGAETTSGAAPSSAAPSEVAPALSPESRPIPPIRPPSGAAPGTVLPAPSPGTPNSPAPTPSGTSGTTNPTSPGTPTPVATPPMGGLLHGPQNPAGTGSPGTGTSAPAPARPANPNVPSLAPPVRPRGPRTSSINGLGRADATLHRTGTKS
ncbi:MAG TPA: NADH-quinone oxidoreductase subunit M [Chthonomonadaceae bacterium]|nr:NADH-quinone oxidoreductase subunit M [Chthonomonadaceae bacterium]